MNLPAPTRTRCLLAPVLVLMAVALGVTGCLNLKPAPDATRHFLLTANESEEAGAGSAGLAVGLAPVDLPAHTSSSWIAIRTGSNELRFAETARWAEPLGRNVQRVLGAQLGSQPGMGPVFLSTWPSAAVQREVRVQFDAWEIHASGEIVLGAQWTVRAPHGSELISSHAGRITRQGPRPDDNLSGTVAAVSDALAELSTQMAASLRP